MSRKFNPFDLNDKVALITGGAGLLGLEHAAALLESGATVILTDKSLHSLARCEKLLGDQFPKGKHLQLEMDVTDKRSIENVEKKLDGWGYQVNILINNAAIDSKVDTASKLSNTSRLELFSLDAWQHELDVGLTGAFLCTQVFGTQMSETGFGGVIVNIASDLSVIAPDQRLYKDPNLPEYLQSVKPVTYSVIKHGLIGLTKYTATYWADKNIRCNALSPGGVANGQGSDFVRQLLDRIPLKRMAEKNEYRSAIQFLCSDASSYMTGHNLILDGGRSSW